jgi:hypothetical protein
MSNFDRAFGDQLQEDAVSSLVTPGNPGQDDHTSDMPNPDGGDGSPNLPGEGLDPSPIHAHGDDPLSDLHPIDPSPENPFGNTVQIPDQGLDPSPIHPHGSDSNSEFPWEGLDPSPVPSGQSAIDNTGVDNFPAPNFSDDPRDIWRGSLPIVPGIVKTTLDEAGHSHLDSSDSDGGNASGAGAAPSANAQDPAQGNFGGPSAGQSDNSSADTQDKGSEHGIIVIGGHDAVADELNPQPLPPGPSGFWDQAAGAAQGSTTVSWVALAGPNDAAAQAPPTHDVSSALDTSAHSATLLSDAHDASSAAVGFDHAEPGAAALHDLLSLNSGAFHMHV